MSDMRAVTVSGATPTRGSWSDPIPSEDAARRAGARRHLNSLRRLRGQLRRQAMVRALVSDGYGAGARRRLANQFGVSLRTVDNDLRAIWRTPGRAPAPVRPRAQESSMTKRLTIRLSGDLHDRLQRKADALGIVASDILRQSLEAFLTDEEQASRGTPPRKTDQPNSLPHDHACAQTILALLPGEIRTDLLAKVALLDMAPEQVIASLLIAQFWPATRPPQVSKVMPYHARPPVTPGSAQSAVMSATPRAG
jgi:hypothetical protein